MGWLFLWLAFGLLTAYEVGELALRGDAEVGLILALLAALVALAALLAIVVGAARRHAPREILPALVVSGVWFGICVWFIYGLGQKPQAVPHLAAGALFLALSFFVSFVGLLVAGYRLAVYRQQLALVRRDSARRSQLPRTRDGSSLPAFDHGGYPTAEERPDAALRPVRPPGTPSPP
jgi:hypothetical protein